MGAGDQSPSSACNAWKGSHRPGRARGSGHFELQYRGPRLSRGRRPAKEALSAPGAVQLRLAISSPNFVLSPRAVVTDIHISKCLVMWRHIVHHAQYGLPVKIAGLHLRGRTCIASISREPTNPSNQICIMHFYSVRSDALPQRGSADPNGFFAPPEPAQTTALHWMVLSPPCHKGLNNRAESSHLPLRKRGVHDAGLSIPGGLQRFVAIFSAVRNLLVPPRSRRSALAIHLHRLDAMSHWKAIASVAA